MEDSVNKSSQSGRVAFAGVDPGNRRWGVILAGGDGRRLLPLTKRIAGDNRPKQFCAIMDGQTLLAQTRFRVERMVQPRQTLLVVTKTHECFYSDQLNDTPSHSLLVQPCNRGTTPAILYSLLRLRESDPNAVVAFFPSDHHFADTDALVAHVDLAFQSAAASGKVVLLGIQPGSPEVDYGWIEPGPALTSDPSGKVFEVSRFWEKPTASLASGLMDRGCLWNSFLMVGRVDAYLGLIRYALPRLLESFESIRPCLFTEREPAALVDLYSAIHGSNFSHEVLAQSPNELAVLSGANLGWTDLGNTSRVISVLGENRISAEWALSFAEECAAHG
jgi:mannose-1-phosphate guanylyltransferase